MRQILTVPTVSKLLIWCKKENYSISFISEFIVLLVHTEVIAVLSTLNNCCLPYLETLCFILLDDASITAKENQMIKMLLKNNYFPVLKRISVMSIVLSCRT